MSKKTYSFKSQALTTKSDKNLAIYTEGSKGQIVVLKELCEHIIVKKKVNDFYNSITQEQIDEIHSKGKLTPLEAVQLWESYDLCVEGNNGILSKKQM